MIFFIVVTVNKYEKISEYACCSAWALVCFCYKIVVNHQTIKISRCLFYIMLLRCSTKHLMKEEITQFLKSLCCLSTQYNKIIQFLWFDLMDCSICKLDRDKILLLLYKKHDYNINVMIIINTVAVNFSFHRLLFLLYLQNNPVKNFGCLFVLKSIISVSSP